GWLMAEQQTDLTAELLKQALDMRESLAIISTKTDGVQSTLTEIKHELSQVKNEATNAKDTANEALSLAKVNKEDIAEIKVNDRWKWGVIVTLVGFAVSIGIAYFN
ncbi:hypothetical protein, partial [Bacillus sp. JJ722]|uniref:hypothetical protein n=1 Tax=Bacillus sp. JJ722 TaxID=3122973 RepID=UPI003000129E